LESKLKSEYGDSSDIPYKIMNAQRIDRKAPNETAKGAKVEKQMEAINE